MATTTGIRKRQSGGRPNHSRLVRLVSLVPNRSTARTFEPFLYLLAQGLPLGSAEPPQVDLPRRVGAPALRRRLRAFAAERFSDLLRIALRVDPRLVARRAVAVPAVPSAAVAAVIQGSLSLLREQADVSVAELAAALGVDPATVSRWERGRHRLGGAALGRYIVALHEPRASR